MGYDAVIVSPIGPLALFLEENHLVGIEFLPSGSSFSIHKNVLLKKIEDQLQHYFKNPHIPFTFPWKLNGTSFQQTVWKRLQRIPVGETITYGALAKELNTASRAIGQACRHNPLPLIIPCHRVVSEKSLGGFFGETQGRSLKQKEWLLNHEKNH